MSSWQPPVIHQGINLDQAEQLAAAENKMADDLDQARLRHRQRQRDSQSDYEQDVAAIEAAHRLTLSQLWLKRQYDAMRQLADTERM